MLDGLIPGEVAKLGPWSLLILLVVVVVLALLNGRLVPRSQAERNYLILEARVANAEAREKIWQEAAATWQATAQAAVANREEQLEQGRTLIQLLSSVPRGQRR